MKTTRFFLQRRLLVAALLLMACLYAKAQEAYLVYTEADETVTFYYDNKMYSRPGDRKYLVGDGTTTPEWNIWDDELGIYNYEFSLKMQRRSLLMNRSLMHV